MNASKNNITDLYKDLPQLIVALDSLEDDANYIHIKDAKENTVYYCPCCKGIVKPRAYKEGIDYQVQSHYYHENGGCNEESFVHYICKMWLFEKDSKFIVNGCEYSVNNIDTEKIYTTSFGNYRPDITVYTKEGKVFFFEIKYSNKKTEHYIPKWDEIGNDVVEVDARYFINQKVENNIPEFNLIYSDGECFIKFYTRKDYDETIALRKLEWKRQDKLNYKIMWEKLDWFWNTLQEFKNGSCELNDVVSGFEVLDYDDMNFCIEIIKKIKCVKLYKILIPIINSMFLDIINAYDIKPYKKVVFVQESPRVFYIAYEITNIRNKIFYYDSFCLHGKFDYYSIDVLEEFVNSISVINNSFKIIDDCHHIDDLKQMVYKKEINQNYTCKLFLREREFVSVKDNSGNKIYSYKYENTFNHFKDYSSFLYLKRNIQIYRNYISSSDKKRKIIIDENYDNTVSKTKIMIDKINNCSNGLWSCSNVEKTNTDGDYYIRIRFNNENISCCVNFNSFSTKQHIFRSIKNNMNMLIKYRNPYDSFRIFLPKDIIQGGC